MRLRITVEHHYGIYNVLFHRHSEVVHDVLQPTEGPLHRANAVEQGNLSLELWCHLSGPALEA